MKMKKKKPNENQFRVLLLFLCSLGVKRGEKQKTKGGSHRTMFRSGFVSRTWFVNGMPFNQEAARDRYL